MKELETAEIEEMLFVVGDEEASKYPGNDIEWIYAKCLHIRLTDFKNSTFKILECYDMPNGKSFRVQALDNIDLSNIIIDKDK